MTSVHAGDVVAEKYVVERLLGSGGMGSVYSARHVALEQLVAIKFLAKGVLPDEEAYARFRLEAKAVVRLKSDHVAKVYDVGVHGDDLPFIVMEHLDGEDLSSMTKARGLLPVAAASEYAMQACEALAEAHALGIVHRDVKPANLFVTRSASGWPLVKVLDFGVSKTTTADGGFDVTRTAAMLGSPKFMSPEQMEDPRGVDARTDVWSLGVCLYRMLAGRGPFEAETLARLCQLVIHEQPPTLRTLRADLPPAYEHIVEKCMEKDRAHRFADVAQLAGALAPFALDPEQARERVTRIAAMLGVPIPAFGPPAPRATPSSGPMRSTFDGGAWATTHGQPPRKRSFVLGAAVGVAVGALAIVGVVALRSRPPPPPLPVVAAPAESASSPTAPYASAASSDTTPYVNATATATATATTTPTAKTARGRRATHTAAAPEGPLPIPDDRK